MVFYGILTDDKQCNIYSVGLNFGLIQTKFIIWVGTIRYIIPMYQVSNELINFFFQLIFFHVEKTKSSAIP